VVALVTLGAFQASPGSDYVGFTLHTDHLGSIRRVTNAAGAIVSAHDYFPFGKEIGPITRSPSTHRFTGKEWDTETDLEYMGARYHSAVQGRFLSTDPALNLHATLPSPQHWNRYAYALNNPLNFVDTDGRYPTRTHNAIIDKAFPGLSPLQRQVLKNASRAVDRDQGAAGAYKHGMRAPGQSVAQAAALAADFVQSNQAAARQAQSSFEAGGGKGFSAVALESFGNALHTVTDSNSPRHQGFQEWGGTDSLSSKFDAAAHVLGESAVSFENFAEAISAAQGVFKETFDEDIPNSISRNPPRNKGHKMQIRISGVCTNCM
jgi:RHS repeat-associated protein